MKYAMWFCAALIAASAVYQVAFSDLRRYWWFWCGAAIQFACAIGFACLAMLQRRR
jgi:hypothetical protein